MQYLQKLFAEQIRVKMEKKVLIIGKEVAIDNVLQSILKDELTCKVDIYYPTNGIENYIQFYNPSLIIATSGHLESLVKEIKTDKKLKNIPVFLLSGFYSEEDYLNTAADDFMSKPVDIRIFIAKVKRFLR